MEAPDDRKLSGRAQLDVEESLESNVEVGDKTPNTEERRGRPTRDGPGRWARQEDNEEAAALAQAILVNIFGGIMKCDTIVEALLGAYENVGITVPLVVRLEGTNVELAREMLEGSDRDIISATDLTDAAQKVVATLGA